MRLLHVVAFSKKLRWLAQTKVITLKTQLHAVIACWKRLSQLSLRVYEKLKFRKEKKKSQMLSFSWGNNFHKKSSFCTPIVVMSFGLTAGSLFCTLLQHFCEKVEKEKHFRTFFKKHSLWSCWWESLFQKMFHVLQSVSCHGFRLTKWDDYFWVDFDHFWIKQYFWRQLGQYWKSVRA